MPDSSALPFGTQSAYTDTLLGPPSQITVSPSTCFQLSLFKDVMKQYRKLDDTIIIRLNRASAQLSDNNRTHHLPTTSGSEESCLLLWREMIAGWEHRQTVLNYCVNIVDTSLNQKRKSLEGQESGLDAKREAQNALFLEEVLRNQIANEDAVEKIVRKRSLEAFKSRCQFFLPPASDERGRQWWNAAENTQ